MDDAFLQFKAHNESKNIFKAARTPAVFFAIAVTMYILSGIFGLVGLYTLANVCNLVMGVGLLTLVLWAYIRYVEFIHHTRVWHIVVNHFSNHRSFLPRGGDTSGTAESSERSARR